MKLSMHQKVEELLIKLKTLIWFICVGESWSIFKTLIPLSFLRKYLNKYVWNDNKKMMLQENGLDKLQITQWAKTLISSGEGDRWIPLSNLQNFNSEWINETSEMSWDMRDPCNLKDPRIERMRLFLHKLSIQSTSKACGRLENQSTLILSQCMNAMQYDVYDET